MLALACNAMFLLRFPSVFNLDIDSFRGQLIFGLRRLDILQRGSVSEYRLFTKVKVPSYTARLARREKEDNTMDNQNVIIE